MALLPGFNGAIQWGSNGAIGVHERLEESVPQDDPQWEKCWKFTSYSIFGKNTEIFHSSNKKFWILISLLKTDLLRGWWFETIFLKVPQWKTNTQWAGAWGAYCLARTPMGLEIVWGVTGFAISSDESPEMCELTGSSKRDVKENGLLVLIDVGINRNQT